MTHDQQIYPSNFSTQRTIAKTWPLGQSCTFRLLWILKSLAGDHEQILAGWTDGEDAFDSCACVYRWHDATASAQPNFVMMKAGCYHSDVGLISIEKRST